MPSENSHFAIEDNKTNHAVERNQKEALFRASGNGIPECIHHLNS